MLTAPHSPPKIIAGRCSLQGSGPVFCYVVRKNDPAETSLREWLADWIGDLWKRKDKEPQEPYKSWYRGRYRQPNYKSRNGQERGTWRYMQDTQDMTEDRKRHEWVGQISVSSHMISHVFKCTY